MEATSEIRETIAAATLRASDEDREQTATRLRHAAAEGRLLADELDERLTEAFSAKTHGELDALVSDLPSSMAHSRRRLVDLVRLRPVIALAAALLIAVVLVVGALGLGMRRSSAVAPDQPQPPPVSHVGPT
jgi:Domain of unknown function (DUF1707)